MLPVAYEFPKGEQHYIYVAWNTLVRILAEYTSSEN